MSVWDDPSLATGGDYVDFNKPGDFVSGIVNVVRTQTFTDTGNVAPQLLLTVDQGGGHSTAKDFTERTFAPGEDASVTAGQIRLKLALAAERPEAGDHVYIRLDQIEPRGGGKTLKHFTVQVTHGVRPPSQAPVEQGQPQYQQPAAPQPPVGNGYGQIPGQVVEQPPVPPPYQAPPVPQQQPNPTATQMPPGWGAAPGQPAPTAPAPQQVQQPAQGGPMDAAAAQAAIAHLSDEQKRQLGIPVA